MDDPRGSLASCTPSTYVCAIFWGSVHRHSAEESCPQGQGPRALPLHQRSWTDIVVKSHVRTTTTTQAVFAQEFPLSVCCLQENSFKLSVSMDVDSAPGAAMRRRQRRLRQFLRHERLSVAMALAEKLHHTFRGQRFARAGEEGHEEHFAPRRQKPLSRGGCRHGSRSLTLFLVAIFKVSSQAKVHLRHLLTLLVLRMRLTKKVRQFLRVGNASALEFMDVGSLSLTDGPGEGGAEEAGAGGGC